MFTEAVSELHIESQPIATQKGAVRKCLHRTSFAIAVDEEGCERRRSCLFAVTHISDSVLEKAHVARFEMRCLIVLQHVVELIDSRCLQDLINIWDDCDHRQVVCVDGASGCRCISGKLCVPEPNGARMDHSQKPPVGWTCQLMVSSPELVLLLALAPLDLQIVVVFERRTRIHIVHMQSS